VYPGKRYLDWDLTDPAGKDVEVVRQIRDDIERRVRGLFDDLLKPSSQEKEAMTDTTNAARLATG